jgi:hypothetical protein
VFFSSRFTGVLDELGYARFRHWRLYGEDGLPKKAATLWLEAERHTLEYCGHPLSRYDVQFVAETGELRRVDCPRLFETPHSMPQPKLFALDALSNEGWLKALRLKAYAPRARRRPHALQEVLFPFSVGWR